MEYESVVNIIGADTYMKNNALSIWKEEVNSLAINEMAVSQDTSHLEWNYGTSNTQPYPHSRPNVLSKLKGSEKELDHIRNELNEVADEYFKLESDLSLKLQSSPHLKDFEVFPYCLFLPIQEKVTLRRKISQDHANRVISYCTI